MCHHHRWRLLCHHKSATLYLFFSWDIMLFSIRKKDSLCPTSCHFHVIFFNVIFFRRRIFEILVHTSPNWHKTHSRFYFSLQNKQHVSVAVIKSCKTKYTLCMTVLSARTFALVTCCSSWTLGRVTCRYITCFDETLTSLNRNIYTWSPPSVSSTLEFLSSSLTWNLCQELHVWE